jgi:hypothetical protein
MRLINARMVGSSTTKTVSLRRVETQNIGCARHTLIRARNPTEIQQKISKKSNS